MPTNVADLLTFASLSPADGFPVEVSNEAGGPGSQQAKREIQDATN